jgi:sporulation protein YlmC with PRC-barrel domain
LTLYENSQTASPALVDLYGAGNVLSFCIHLCPLLRDKVCVVPFDIPLWADEGRFLVYKQAQMEKQHLKPTTNTIREVNNLDVDNFTGANQGPLYSNTPLKYLTALSMVGDKVHNETDEHLGEIKDIMIDVTTGRIDYFIIQFGGFLGIGIKYFAIPFNLIRVDPDKRLFIFNQGRDVLERAPGFDMDHWPDTNIHLEKVNSYWSFMG